MTGIEWLDWVTFTLCAAMAVVLGVQLARGRHVLAHRATGLHAVMALGMAAMAQPRFDPLPVEVWMAAFVASAAAAVVVCGRHARGHAVHHIVGSLFMVVAFAAHGAHDPGGAPEHTMVDPATGATVAMSGTAHGAHGAAHTDAAGLTAAVGDLAGWPVWPLVGAAFAAYGAFLVWGMCGLRYPSRPSLAGLASLRLPDQACGAVMAATMATMAFTL